MDGCRMKAGLAAVLLVGGLAACGDDGEDGGGDTTDATLSEAGAAGGGNADEGGSTGDSAAFTEPCEMLERSDVEEQFGDGASAEVLEQRGAVCFWGIEHQGTTSEVQLTLARPGDDGWDGWRDQYSETMVADVEGAGEDAFWTEAGELLAFSDGLIVIVTGLDSGAQERAVALARLVFDRV